MGEVAADAPSVGAFSSIEVSEVVAKYPRVRQTAPGVVEGVLDIDATFEGEIVQDSFEVRIIGPAGYPNALPLLEIAPGRIAAIQSRQRVVDARDLHQNGATACVCAPQDERKRFPPGSRLIHFVENLAVPFLYALSRFERTGRWPWGEYSHGALGVLEYYADFPTPPDRGELARIAGTILRDSRAADFREHLRRPRRTWPCLCGIRRPLRQCHPRAWKGIVFLSRHLKNEGLTCIDEAIDVTRAVDAPD